MTSSSDVPEPPPGTCVTTFAGRTLWLLPQRAAFDPAAGALIVADPHLGKAAAFRGAGVPVPTGTTAADLARLDAALHATAAEQLWILGDLLHARSGRAPNTMEAVGAWRRTRPGLEVLLVRGNHDVAAGDPPAGWKMRVVEEPHAAGRWVLRHVPAEDADAPVLAGHLHPSVRLAGGAERMAPPCFHGRGRLLVLPAFGSFTGTARVRAAPGDRIWAVGPDQVVEVRVGRG